MFYLYILLSTTSNNYYVGYSNDPRRRVLEHNTKPFNTYTSKHRPWRLVAAFECGSDEKKAIEIERFIKKQKSRKLIEMMISDSPLTGVLAQLVRVPDVRD